MTSGTQRTFLATGASSEDHNWAQGVLSVDGLVLNLAQEHVEPHHLGPTLEPGLTIAFSGIAQQTIPWGSQAWEDLTQAVDGLEGPGARLLLRGHHGHILADAPACLGWLDRCQESGLEVGIGLSPASMLVSSMMDTLDEHLDRMFQYLGQRIGAVVLEDIALDSSGTLCPRPVGMGQMPGGLLGQLIDEHVPEEIPICFQAPDVMTGTRWLWPD